MYDREFNMHLRMQSHLNKQNKPRGITLLETMLAVALILMTVIIGLQQYKQVVLKRHVAQIKNSVQLLTAGLERYYMTNCYWFFTSYSTFPISLTENPSSIPVTTPASPTLQSYIAQPNLIDNSYNTSLHGINAYTYSIDTTNDYTVLRISSVFNVSKTMQNTLAALLKPTVISNQTSTSVQFTWAIAPQNTKITATTLNPNLAYIQALAMNLVDSASRQVSYQYIASGNQQANLCAYWQQPRERCKLTNDTTRCNYKDTPS
jgi:Tfp pilus assembly protein PilE